MGKSKCNNDSECDVALELVEHRSDLRVQLVIDQFEEAEAYRKLDDFFENEERLLDLMQVLGIHDEAVLERFLSHGFTAQTAPAIEMIPIVFAAWASNEVTDEESAAAITAIFNSELPEFPKTFAVVQSWLDNRPAAELWDLWFDYTACRLRSFSMEQRVGRYMRVIGQVRQVARASGGWLGIGSVCKEERRIIDQIDVLFQCSFTVGAVSG